MLIGTWAIDDDDNLGQNPMFHVVRSTGDTVVGNKLGIGSDIPSNKIIYSCYLTLVANVLIDI